MSRSFIAPAAAAAAAACTGLAGLALAGGAAGAPAAGSCNVKSLYGKAGYPSYVTALNVHGVSCATGVKLVKAYYDCRVRAGGPFNGRCHHAVLGFTCSEQRQGISFVYNATVTCRHGKSVVIHHYTQNR
jgi:hypothetical protein